MEKNMLLHASLRRSLAAALLLSSLSMPSRAETDPAALVDALNAVFGKHEGARAGHANGLCVKGAFKPAPGAAQLSKAAHFTGAGPFPVIGRFSMGGGDPAAPNTAKDNARGLALHIDLGKDQTTDMVLLSAPVFLAKTPEQFLTLLQTVATKDKDKIGAFFKDNPESTRQGAWLNARPLPASYATTNYYSVHAFTLTNAEGKTQVVKWKAVPAGGEVTLTDDEAKGKAADFYTPKLKDRLAKSPAEFKLQAVLGEKGDPEDDPTAFWPEDRKSVDVGTISISALEDQATCDAGMFDPTNVTTGIEGPKNDGIYLIRSPAYAVSLSRRAK
jgi:catalase